MAGSVIALTEDVADGAQTALARLDDLAAWRARAEAAVEELSGRTARRLVEALTGAVAVGMSHLAQRSGASPAVVCRNLAILAERGVAREISGQAR